jgi:hypothetical protein
MIGYKSKIRQTFAQCQMAPLVRLGKLLPALVMRPWQISIENDLHQALPREVNNPYSQDRCGPVGLLPGLLELIKINIR